MGNCMGLILLFCVAPTPRRFDNANHGLPARMDVDVFDRGLLLALAAVSVEAFEQRCVGP
jgi:hypothetical protein